MTSRYSVCWARRTAIALSWFACTLAPAGLPACGKEQPPRAVPFDCIEGWPTGGDAPAASLAVTPRVLWTQTLGALESPPHMPDQLWTIAGAQVVVAFDTTVAAFDRATGARTWTTPLAAPRRDVLISYAAPAADAEGNLYGLAWDAYSLDARGAARWQVTTDATVSGGGEVSTLHRPPVVLSPEGLLFVNDGRQQRALRTGDGSEVWRRSDAFVFAGAGPVVVGATEVRSASDGALRGHVRASDGSRLYVWGLAGFGFIGGNGDSGAVEAVDRCDRTLWSLPPDPGWAYGIAGVGPGGVTYVFRSPPTDTTRPSTLFTISAQGAPLASAAANGGSLVAIGADGTAYLQSCLNGDPEIVALGPDLQPLWRLPVEGICAATGLLDDDGVLYMFTLLDGRYRLVAAQTTSPGLSRDGWPSRWHDARATRWLLP